MSLTASLLFSGRIAVEPYKPQVVHNQPFICLGLADAEQSRNTVTLHFYSLAQIEKLRAALDTLANDFAAFLANQPQFSRPLKPGETEPGVPPWPVAPGTDTTGWTDSQILGEQPSPGAEDRPIELSPEPVDPWKEKGEASDPAEAEPTDLEATPILSCRSCGHMLLNEAEVQAQLCDDCAAVAARVQF